MFSICLCLLYSSYKLNNNILTFKNNKKTNQQKLLFGLADNTRMSKPTYTKLNQAHTLSLYLDRKEYVQVVTIYKLVCATIQRNRHYGLKRKKSDISLNKQYVAT